MKEMHSFADYISKEEFDIDGITEDMKCIKESNGLKAIESEELRKILCDYIQQTICMSSFNLRYPNIHT